MTLFSSDHSIPAEVKRKKEMNREFKKEKVLQEPMQVAISCNYSPAERKMGLGKYF